MDKKILGVCLWISDKTNIDVLWVRLGFIVAAVIGFGAPILIYMVLFLALHFKLIE